MKRTTRMTPQVLEPYTEQDVRNWNEGLAKCEEAMRLCELSIQAGFPCQSDLDACTAVRDQIRKMKEVFAPGHP